MRQTIDGRTGLRARHRPTRRERLFVLGGFVLAALYSAVSLAAGAGDEAIGPLWLAAVLWTVPSSLACALRRGFRHRDWSAFGGRGFEDDGDTIDWSYGNQTFMGRWNGQHFDTSGYLTHFHSP